jgi:hypothetical protein
MIDKDVFMGNLRSEGPAFTHSLLDLELPDGGGRLQLPVLETGEKRSVMAENQTPLQAFIADHCDLVPGATIPVAEFYDRFKEKVDQEVLYQWSKIKVGRNLPDGVPSGKYTPKSVQTLGNIRWKGDVAEPQERLVLDKTGYLKPASKCGN